MEFEKVLSVWYTINSNQTKKVNNHAYLKLRYACLRQSVIKFSHFGYLGIPIHCSLDKNDERQENGIIPLIIQTHKHTNQRKGILNITLLLKRLLISKLWEGLKLSTSYIHKKLTSGYQKRCVKHVSELKFVLQNYVVDMFGQGPAHCISTGEEINEILIKDTQKMLAKLSRSRLAIGQYRFFILLTQIQTGM